MAYSPDNLVRNNLTATTDPTVNNDDAENYSENSVWLNVNTNKAFFCADPATGAAVWLDLNPALFDDSAGSDVATFTTGTFAAQKAVKFYAVIEAALTKPIRGPFINGDTTAANYHRNQYGAQDGGNPAGFEDSSMFGYSISAGDFVFFRGTVVHAAGQVFIGMRATHRVSGTSLDTDVVDVIWNGNADIDELSFVVDDATNGIDSLSEMQVWKTF